MDTLNEALWRAAAARARRSSTKPLDVLASWDLDDRAGGLEVTYLLDTSVLTRLRGPAVRARVHALGAEGLARSAMTDLEVGFSARKGHEWERLMAALETFELVDIGPNHFAWAQQVQRLLPSGASREGTCAISSSPLSARRRADRAPLRRRLRPHRLGHRPSHRVGRSIGLHRALSTDQAIGG